MKKIMLSIFCFLAFGCAIAPPQFRAPTDASEAEYAPYLNSGNATLTGQAFLTQQGGGVVKAAGREVTLDPATSTGNEWWNLAGKMYVHRALVPSSPNFLKTRKTTIADAEGRFKFENLPAGKYYVRTEVTWMVGYNIEGGLVGKIVDVKDGGSEVILNQYPE